MDFFQSAYFDFFTIAAMIPVIFMATLAFVFISVKKKSKATKQLIISFFFLFVFYLFYFISAVFYHPLAAFHRWVTVAMALYGTLYFSLIIFYFPDERHPLFGKIYKLSLLFANSIIFIAFIIQSLKSETVYKFEGHYWDFEIDFISKIVGLFVIFELFLVLGMGIWRAVIMKTRIRWSALTMAFAIFAGLLIPAIVNVLSRDGLLDRGVYQVTQDISTVAGFFIVSIVFINSTKDRTSVFGKVLGISMTTVLLFFQAYIYITFDDFEDDFNTIWSQKTKFHIKLGTVPQEASYKINYNSILNKSQISGLKNNHDFEHTEFNQEYYNSYMFETIYQFTSNGQLAETDKLLAESNIYFSAYKNAIKQFLVNHTENKQQLEHDFYNYTIDLKSVFLYTKNKISALPDNEFRAHLQNFLPDAKAGFANKVIKNFIKSKKLRGKELKKEVLRFFAPMNPSGTRIFRKDKSDNQHFISYLHVDLGNQSVTEIAYPYLIYRESMHKTSLKFAVLLLIMSLVIVLGFPLFFWPSLLLPIRRLIDGIRQMQSGNLKVQIPVRVEDEFGYMSHSFNEMAKIIYASTENLEATVQQRTAEIEQQKEEIVTQAEVLKNINDALEKEREHTMGSIRTALTIQKSILPVTEKIKEYFNTFILFKPKDIVSGDFYWFSQIKHNGSEYFFIATVDCTGHGVPGAFMSMIGSRILSEIVNQRKIYETDKILEILDYLVKKALNQETTNNDDGMDVCLCRIEKQGGKYNVCFTGARRPLFHYVNKSQKVEIRSGDRRPIGGAFFKKIEFSRQLISLETNDTLYLTSDGIIDQNAPNRKKFGTKRFLQTIEYCGHMTAEHQKKYIQNALTKHQEDEPQRDDITVIGLKIKE